MRVLVVVAGGGARVAVAGGSVQMPLDVLRHRSLVCARDQIRRLNEDQAREESGENGDAATHGDRLRPVSREGHAAAALRAGFTEPARLAVALGENGALSRRLRPAERED